MDKTDSLIPGYANFMEDIQVNTEVSVSEGGPDEPETIETQETTVTEAADTQEAAEEAEGDQTETEMVMRSFDEVEKMQAFIESNGVDNTFLYFFGNRFAAAGHEIPSHESFDAVGNPNSALSIACLESLKETATKVWTFIKRVCKKIVDILTKIVDAVIGRFRNMNTVVGKLRDKLYSIGSHPDMSLLNGVKVLNVWEFMRHFELRTKAVAAYTKVADIINSLYKDVASFKLVKATDKLNSALEEVDQWSRNFRSHMDAVGEIDASKVQYFTISRVLDNCGDILKGIDTLKRSIEVVKADARGTIAIAENYEKRASAWNQKEAAEMARNAREFASALNKASTVGARLVSNDEKCVRKICLAVSRILARWSNTNNKSTASV